MRVRLPGIVAAIVFVHMTGAAEPAVAVASARLLVTPDTGAGASTYRAGSFEITNTGTKAISRVVLDLGTTVLPDIVFAPTNAAGDDVAKGFTVDAAGGTGVRTPSGATGSPPFSAGTAGDGYERLTIDFRGFGAGQTLAFSLDIDPRSVDGHSGSGSAGSISGLELAGATLRVTYVDGTSEVAEVMGDGGRGGGGEAYARPNQAGAVSVGVGGLGGGQKGFLPAGGPKIARVSGPANATVRLLVIEGDVLGVGGNAPTPSDPAFDANTAEEVTYFTVRLDGSGRGSANITAALSSRPADDKRYVVTGAVVIDVDPARPGPEPVGPVARPVTFKLRAGAS